MQETFFDTPSNYPKNRFYIEGSNPQLVEHLINYLNKNISNITHIYIAFYLFNNQTLYNYLKRICEEYGVSISIISIPLEGYDTKKPKTLFSFVEVGKQSNKEYSKNDLAKEIYNDICVSNLSNFRFYIFPHLYIRSQNIKPFSRGSMPYSLHIKHFYAEMIDDQSIIGLSSSNLAGRDLAKEENLILFKPDKQQKNEAMHFYKALIDNSIPIQEFKNSKNHTNYRLKELEYTSNSDSAFIAPFFKDSPQHAESFLIALLQKAKNRILIVAQHQSAYKISYRDENNKQIKRNGILYYALEKAKKGIPVYCLSQTFPGRNSYKFRNTKNQKSFSEFVEAGVDIPSFHYKVNENIHSKYIIIDDIVVITSCNLTPTQFIYTKVQIDYFNHMPGKNYKGIHCEVGVFYKFDEKEIVDNYVKNFRKLWTDINSVQTIK